MMSNKQRIPINVSSRILRHISRGIYRSPAGALKELVSNSYDAGAKKVTVNTGYPVIEKIIITDNGKGMSQSKFINIIQNIGFSEKNQGDFVDIVNSRLNSKRKTIGHYGIGFLAIGQLAKKAIITSKETNKNVGIKVILDFDQFETHKEKGIERSKAKDEIVIEQTDTKKEIFNIGECNIETVSFDKSANSQSFTKIELTEIRSDVQRQIVGNSTAKLLPEADLLRQYSSSYEDILILLREKEQQSSTIKLDGGKVPNLREYFYEMLLWELGVYSPVSYPNYGEFEKGHDLYHFSKYTNNSEFELVVDGFVISKPFEKWFWEEKNGYKYKVYKWEDEVYHKNYKVSAYLIYQPGTMIRPKSMQGVLVRENLVAIGLYDTTFLNYPFNEGNKFNSLSGEIYATGLAGAMNVDRDSFNQTAEEYVALVEWFHGKLYNEVFPDIKKFQKTKESPSRVKSAALVMDVLNELAIPGKKIKQVKLKSLGKTNKNRIIVNNNTLIINTDHKDCDMSIAKREKLLLACALIINDYISPETYQEIVEKIEKTKKIIRKND